MAAGIEKMETVTVTIADELVTIADGFATIAVES
jgi:hypothetical protein